MQYIVSAENSTYFYWQLEILIESFLVHNQADNLLICLAENELPKNINYCKNLPKYSKKIIHKNFGKEKKYLKANKFFCLYNLSKNNQLEYPFVFIHPDMILKSPADQHNDENFNLIINFENRKNKSSEEYFEQNFKNYNDLDENIKNFNFSMPIIFNNNILEYFKNNFFESLFINFEKIYNSKKNENDFPFEITAWKYSLLESLGFYSLSSRFLSVDLMNPLNANVPFVHYDKGIIPFFNKKYFTFNDFRFHEDPYETLLKYNVSPQNDYINYIINSYKKRNK